VGQSSPALRPDHVATEIGDSPLPQAPVQVQVQEQEQGQGQEQPSDTGQVNSSTVPEAIHDENIGLIVDESISETPQNTGSSPRWDEMWPIVGQCSLTDEEVELLRHFGHCVAPWVSFQILLISLPHTVPKVGLLTFFEQVGRL
jgi:hypothetical protein